MNNFTEVGRQKWLSKDRFWNFIFAFGMIIGFSITFALPTRLQTEYKLGSIFMWFTILGVPLVVRHFSKTTFLAKGFFLNSEGKKLSIKQNVPNGFLTIATTIILTVLTGAIIDNIFRNMETSIGTPILFAVFFLVPTLFFILKNCPISILFNCKFWNFGPNSFNYLKSSEGMRTTVIPNPMYGSKPANTFNRNR